MVPESTQQMYVLSALITLNHGNADFTYITLNGLYGIACLYYTQSIAINEGE